MRLVALALLGAVGLGCQNLPAAHLSLLSTRAYPAELSILATGVEAENCIYYGPVLFATELPHLGVAIQRAIRSTPGANALANVQVFYEELDFLVVNRLCYRVVGDAARFE